MPHQHRKHFVATVASNEQICREHFRLLLRVEDFPQTDPGQFIQITCDHPGSSSSSEDEINWLPGSMPHLHDRDLSAPRAFLRRPFSLAGRREANASTVLEIIHRVVGVGTEWLSRLRTDDPVDLIGPLGNRFELPRGDAMAILVGGGVGIPPMLYLAERLAGRSAVAFCGAATKDLLPLRVDDDQAIREFAQHGIPSVIATDDGTLGYRGYVTGALENWLDNSSDSRESQIRNAIIYTCGPELMMKRVVEIARGRGFECQVAAERAMACGMGTCQSCCIRVRKADPARSPLVGSEWCWRLTCTDGPVFRGSELLW